MTSTHPRRRQSTAFKARRLFLWGPKDATPSLTRRSGIFRDSNIGVRSRHRRPTTHRPGSRDSPNSYCCLPPGGPAAVAPAEDAMRACAPACSTSHLWLRSCQFNATPPPLSPLPRSLPAHLPSLAAFMPAHAAVLRRPLGRVAGRRAVRQQVRQPALRDVLCGT